MRKVREISLAREGLPLRQVGAVRSRRWRSSSAERRAVGRCRPSTTALEALLFPGPGPSRTASGLDVHRELRKGVTLMLCGTSTGRHPDGYLHPVLLHYRAFGLDLPMRQEHRAGEKLFVDFPGPAAGDL